MTHDVESAEETQQLGAKFVRTLKPGDVVLFTGQLGAGKTTMIRGMLEGLGHQGVVRSPTFNLVQTFDTHPPVMHADLYRVKTYKGVGLEDYLDTHVCLIEWPDRAYDLLPPATCWTVDIEFKAEGRLITVLPPNTV